VFENKERYCWWYRANLYARDPFEKKFVGHPMNGEKGRRYRMVILERARYEWK
jgi:hypothetical protein